MQVKPRFLCENHVRGSPLGDAFWYNSRVFLCFFLLFFRPCAQNGILWIFMRFWAYFRLHFLSFLQQGGSSLFYNPFKQNQDFQGSRASIFQCFFLSFSAFHSGPHFSVFFGDFRVAKAPVLELVGLIFRHQKKESKKGLRLFAAGRGPGGGVPFKQDNRFLRKQLFNISSLQRCLKARWRICSCSDSFPKC